MLPSKDKLNICFAHAAYRMADRFAARDTGIAHFQVWTPDEFAARLAEADVVVVSMMWRNDLVPQAKQLKFIQSISAGIDQYDREAAARARHPPGQRRRRQCQRRRRARHGADPGPEAADPHRPRQPGRQALARHDLRHRRARGRARRQDPADRRPWGASARGWRSSPRPSTCAWSATRRDPSRGARARTPSTATIGWPSCCPPPTSWRSPARSRPRPPT